MRVLLQGKFIANESKTNRETGEVVPYGIVLTGNQTVRVKGVTIENAEQFDDVQVPVELSCFDSKIYCTYSDNN